MKAKETIDPSVESENKQSPNVLQGRPVLGRDLFEQPFVVTVKRQWWLLLGGDFANKVEDVAKDVKKLHAMQAIMKWSVCEVWHLFYTLEDVRVISHQHVHSYFSPHDDQVRVSRVFRHVGHESGFCVRCASWYHDYF